MAQVSGTISKTSFPTRLVIEHAYRRCRLPAQAITGEMIDVAFDQLYLMLSDWANEGVQLWCIEKLILPMYEAQAQLPLPIGTVDVLNANIRQVTPQSGVVSQIPTQYQLQFSSPTLISTIGLDWNGPSIPIKYETSQDGITWKQYASFTVTADVGVRSWFDVDGSPAALYSRITSLDGLTPLPISNFIFANNPLEITIARLNRDDYINLPNKTFQGRPLQYWYDRQRDIPIMTLWPAPSLFFTAQQITVWRKRYIMDVGNAANMLDIPQRWFDAVTYNLAVKLAEASVSVDPTILTILAPKAQMSLQKARMEERDNSPIYWSPNLRVYTR